MLTRCFSRDWRKIDWMLYSPIKSSFPCFHWKQNNRWAIYITAVGDSPLPFPSLPLLSLLPSPMKCFLAPPVKSSAQGNVTTHLILCMHIRVHIFSSLNHCCLYGKLHFQHDFFQACWLMTTCITHVIGYWLTGRFGKPCLSYRIVHSHSKCTCDSLVPSACVPMTSTCVGLGSALSIVRSTEQSGSGHRLV